MEKSTVREIIRVLLIGLMAFFMGRAARLAGESSAELRPMPDDVPQAVIVEDSYDEVFVTDEEFAEKISEIVIDDYEKLPADGGKTGWAILVDTEKKNTRVFRYGDCWVNELDVPCVVGTANTPTPKGTFEIYQMHDGFYLNGHFWAYMSAFSGNYGFHSVPYDGDECIDSRLGEALSHGCIRLARDDAKWIQENVPLLTPVTIF